MGVVCLRCTYLEASLLLAQGDGRLKRRGKKFRSDWTSTQVGVVPASVATGEAVRSEVKP